MNINLNITILSLMKELISVHNDCGIRIKPDEIVLVTPSGEEMNKMEFKKDTFTRTTLDLLEECILE